MTIPDKRKQDFIAVVNELITPLLNDEQLVSQLAYQSVNFVSNIYYGFEGKKLLVQLEGNAVYYEEYNYQLCSEMASFMCRTGSYEKPINPFTAKRISVSRFHEITMESTELQLKYIRDTCNNCEFHFRHMVYDNLRRRKLTLSVEEFIPFIIYDAERSKFTNLIVQLMFQNSLSTNYYLNIFPFFYVPDVTNYLYAITLSESNLVINEYLRNSYKENGIW
ncbi:MAG TPA: hypothetical protein DCL08_04820 [Anaerolineaceae bacterium]|nr:hypothetical protein [Anaerolineaceae bacterium]